MIFDLGSDESTVNQWDSMGHWLTILFRVFLILNLWWKSPQRIIQKDCQIIPTGVSDRGWCKPRDI